LEVVCFTDLDVPVNTGDVEFGVSFFLLLRAAVGVPMRGTTPRGPGCKPDVVRVLFQA
jgi:hypothetical protein